MTDFQTSVVAVLERLEQGEVVSYGEVAAEAGYPGAGRAVGNLLRRVDGLPWWRVVPASGRLVDRLADEQARRLRSEGIAVQGGRIVGSIRC